MSITFLNLIIPINEITILIYIGIIGLSYCLLFAKHHKRNEMDFSEIFPLLMNYCALSILSTIFLIIGIKIVLSGYEYREERIEVIKSLAIGFVIIILTILNFIFYVKRHRKDLVIIEREIKREKNNRIGEILQIIIFILMIIASIYNIVIHFNFIDKTQKYIEIGKSFFCIIIAIFLLYNLNPLDIRKKLKLKRK